MSDLSQLSGVERKLDFGAVRTGLDPTQTSAGIPLQQRGRFSATIRHSLEPISRANS